MALTTAFIGSGNPVNDAEATTNWNNTTISAVEQWDLRIQGSYSNAFQASNKDGMGYYDYSGTGSFDFTSGGTHWGQHVYIWVNYLSPFNLEAKSAGVKSGLSLVLGSDSSNYAGWTIFDGTDIDKYSGGWKLWVLDPRKPPSWVTGTPSFSAIDTFGVWVQTNSTFRSDNLFIDEIKVGTGIRAYGTGTAGDSWQDILDDDMGTEANRWGIAQEQDGVIYLYGKVDIGDDVGTNSTTFSDQGKVIQYIKQEYYDANGNWAPLIGDDLFALNIVSNSTGSTTFTDGVIVGSDGGRAGSTIIGPDGIDVTINLDDGNNASNDINLYNTSFKKCKGGINWINDSDHVFYGGSIVQCGQFDPVGAPIIRNCNFNETKYFPTSLSAAIMDDGGAFTDETTDANDSGGSGDVNLLPATPVANDAFYFGSDYQFNKITIDITTSGGATTVLAWEYYNGSSWASVTVADGTDNFNNVGMCRVTFTEPGTWSTTTVNSQGPYYYIRARVTTAGNQAVAEQMWLSGESAGAALKWNTNIDIQKCNFLANSDTENDPGGIEHDTIYSVYTGTADDPGSSTTVLYDAGATFTGGNVAVNDYIYNEDDGSYAKVTALTDVNNLAHETLVGGTLNDWSNGDNYSISPAITYTNLIFSGNDADVVNLASGGDGLFISKGGTSNPASFTGGNVEFLGSVTITITVKNSAGTEIQNAQTGVFLTSDGTELINADTNASGVVTDSYTGSTPAEVKVWIRKASSGSTRYKNYSSIQNITASGLLLDVTLVEDPNNNATT